MASLLSIDRALQRRATSLRDPFGDRPNPLEDPRGSRSEDEAADMGEVRDAAALHIRHGAQLTERLGDEPESYEWRRGVSRSLDVVGSAWRPPVRWQCAINLRHTVAPLAFLDASLHVAQ